MNAINTLILSFDFYGSTIDYHCDGDDDWLVFSDNGDTFEPSFELECEVWHHFRNIILPEHNADLMADIMGGF
jgi:hypothetical protein